VTIALTSPLGSRQPGDRGEGRKGSQAPEGEADEVGIGEGGRRGIRKPVDAPSDQEAGREGRPADTARP
jgi:hypothetical protein